MPNYNSIKVGLKVAILPSLIVYLLSSSIIATGIVALALTYYFYKYNEYNNDRKEIISIFQNGDDVHLMLGDDNWHTIKINQTSDMAKSILDRLNANLEFLKSHIKRIDLINIENKPLQEQLNRLLVA